MITQGFCEDILARHDFDQTEVKLLAKAWIEQEQAVAELRDRLEVLTEPGTPIAIVNAMFDYAIAECGHQRHGVRHAFTTIQQTIQRERENTDRLAEALEIVSGCYVRCRCGALVCKRCKDDQDVDYALKALAQHAALRSGE